MMQHKKEHLTAVGEAGCFLLYIFTTQKENKESKKNEKESQKSQKFSILKEEQKKEPKRSQKGSRTMRKRGGLETKKEEGKK